MEISQITTMKDKISNALDIDLSKDENYLIYCPFHPNSNTEAFSIHGKKGFQCFGCGVKGKIKDLYYKLFPDEEEDDQFGKSIDSLDEIDTNENIYISKQAESINQMRIDLQEFFYSRKIDVNILKLLKYRIIRDPKEVDFGYVRFYHDRFDSFVSRKFLKLLPESRPKYREIKEGDKRILGISMLDRTLNYIILVESIYNWFTLKQLGFTNVGCTYGSKVSPQTAYDVVGYCSIVFILFDNDYAGFDGSRNLAKTLLEFGIKPIEIKMPVEFGNDCNNTLQDGKGELLKEWLQGQLSMENNYDVENFDQVQWLKDHFNKEVKPMEAYSTGLPSLDHVLLGGYREGLHGISGNTSVGKTSFAVFLMTNFLRMRPGSRALYVTYEVSDEQIWSRIASQFNKKSWAEIHTNKASLEEDKLKLLYNLGKVITVMQHLTVKEIARLIPQHDVTILDYIQKVPPMGIYDNEAKAYSATADYLLKTSMHYKKVILALSSKSKDQYKNDDISLKGSGDLEYSFASILHLSKHKEGDINLIKASYGKNTMGELTSVLLKPDFAHIKFSEYEGGY